MLFFRPGLHFRIILTLLWITSTENLQAGTQSDSSSRNLPEGLKIAAYLDLYAGSFAPYTKGGSVPYFVNMNRNRELAVNLCMLDFNYENKRIRARLAPGFGTYMNSNYAAEPGSLASLVEANAGFCLFPERKIWLDAGVLGSPYSSEGFLSRDQHLYSRSLAPEYVPYYLSGIKLSIPLSKCINLYIYGLNGWQQIRDKNQYPAIGTQLEYLGKRSRLNWNTFAGDERDVLAGEKGRMQRMRWFTDVYWIYNPEGKVSATACAYAGIQEYAAGWNSGKAIWWQLNGSLRYRLSEKNSFSARLEYFSDPNAAVIEPVFGSKGFNTGSGSLCWNYNLSSNATFRFEGRQFLSSESLFGDGKNGRQATWLLAGLTFWL